MSKFLFSYHGGDFPPEAADALGVGGGCRMAVWCGGVESEIVERWASRAEVGRMDDADVGRDHFRVLRDEPRPEERAPGMRHDVTAPLAETRQQNPE